MLPVAVARELGLAAASAGSPPYPDNTVLDVRTFGAKGDGVTDDGAAVEQAFAAAAAAAAASAGGSSVTIRLPAPGVYVLDRQLVLNASNTLLSIEGTLRWRWAKNLSFTSRWAQNASQHTTMLSVGPGAGAAGPLTNVSFGGGGTLDGQGFMWWPMRYHVYEYINEQAWPPYFLTFSSVQGCATVHGPLFLLSCDGNRAFHR